MFHTTFPTYEERAKAMRKNYLKHSKEIKKEPEGKFKKKSSEKEAVKEGFTNYVECNEQLEEFTNILDQMNEKKMYS